MRVEYSIKEGVDGRGEAEFEVYASPDDGSGEEYLERFQIREVAEDYCFALQDAREKRLAPTKLEHPTVEELAKFLVKNAGGIDWPAQIALALLENYNITPR